MIPRRNGLIILPALLLLLLLPAVVLGFAAANTNKKNRGSSNNKNKGNKKATTNKGFGAAPPTLESVVSQFRTRMPDDPDAQACPCGSHQNELPVVYGECCGPLHAGTRNCFTMTDVLKSRYSAFSWRNVNYVMDTTHVTCRDWREDRIAWAKDLNKGGMFDSFDFVDLQAGPEEPGQDENEGFVEFQVTLRAKEDWTSASGGELAGKETVVSERSRFLRNPEDLTWSYASGDVRSTVDGLEDTQLNT
jgi:SEC-C motif-containing protein